MWGLEGPEDSRGLGLWGLIQVWVKTENGNTITSLNLEAHTQEPHRSEVMESK